MKTEKKWTPEPWDFAYNDATAVLKPTGDRTYRYIAQTNSQTDRTALITHEEHEEDVANASRIVACVNGCAGIADPSAVNELLGASKLVIEMMERSGYSTLDDSSAGGFLYHSLRNAIARADGRQHDSTNR